jgi:hypothetical protein
MFGGGDEGMVSGDVQERVMRKEIKWQLGRRHPSSYEMGFEEAGAGTR